MLKQYFIDKFLMLSQNILEKIESFTPEEHPGTSQPLINRVALPTIGQGAANIYYPGRAQE